MKLPEDQARLKGLLQETITLLCKNGLNYKAEFSVEALIVVTLDQEQMFHANIKETIAKEGLSLTLDADSEKEMATTPTPRSKSAKKRRPQRDDSPEVPKKKSSVQVFSEPLGDPEDDGDELSNASYHNVKEENDSSSECVLVKDELANRTLHDPVPLSDLEYVDTGNDQGGLHYGAGVWNVQSVSGEQDGASNTSGIEGDQSQQAGWMLNSTTPPRAVCHLCFVTFSSGRNLKRHLESIHANKEKAKSFQCTICLRSYTRKDNLKAHMRISHKDACKDVPQFKCAYCRKEFILQQNLESHVLKYHPDVKNDHESERSHVLQQNVQSHTLNIVGDEKFENASSHGLPDLTFTE